jgi:hypothetical protein
VFKPNIAGVGSQINAPALGSGDRGVKFDGTSMSGPTVAGTAAVLIERLRADGMAPAGPLTGDEGLGAVDVSALLVNGAHRTVYDTKNTSGKSIALARGGAGRVDLSVATRLETAVRAGTSAGDLDGTPFGVYFGFPAFDDIYTDERPFYVENASDTERQYRVDVRFLHADDAASGVQFTPSETTFTVPAGGVKDLELNLRADPSRMKRYDAYGGDRSGASVGLTSAEHDAMISVTEVGPTGAPVEGGDVSRLPVYVLPKPASVIEFADDGVQVNSSGEVTVNRVTNLGARGVVDFFVPAGQDGPDMNMDPLVDIDHVGARVTRDEEGARVVEILVENKGIRNMPLDSRVFVGIDTDLNGSLDYMAIAQDVAYWPPPECGNDLATFSGTIGVAVARMATQNPLAWQCTGTLRYLAGVDQHSAATILPILVSDLGIPDERPVALNLVVFHAAFLPGAVAPGKLELDGAPNDGILMIGNTVALGPGRFTFREDGSGVMVDPWVLPISSNAETAFNLERTNGSSEVGELWAYHRFAMPADRLVSLPIDERSGGARSLYLPALEAGQGR